MIRRHTVSFQHAFDGIVYAFRSQPNFRIHLLAASIVSLCAWYFKLPANQWLFLIFTFTWILTAEMINTALEAMVDLLSPDYHQLAKIAKDTSAGMVLISAVGSVVIGLIIFIPYLWPSF